MLKYSELTNYKVKLADQIPLLTPFGLFIDPTNICNFRCSFCPRNLPEFKQYAGNYTDMTMSTFKKILDDLHEFPDKLKVIRLYYIGEPMLNNNFIEMLSLLAENNVCDRIEITTNGSVLTDNIINGIIDVALKSEAEIYLRFSIYSVNDKHFFDITKNKSVKPDYIMENVRRMYKAKIDNDASKICVYAKKLRTISEEDDEFLKLYSDIADDVQLEDPMNWSGFGGEENFLLKEEYSDAQLDNIIKQEFIPKVCAYPFNTMSIMSDGSVIVCCVDWSRKTYIGNVNENSLLEIWNGKLLHNFRMLHLQGKRELNEACANCVRMPKGVDDYLDDTVNLLIKKIE